jgi:hypothetical protein
MPTKILQDRNSDLWTTHRDKLHSLSRCCVRVVHIFLQLNLCLFCRMLLLRVNELILDVLEAPVEIDEQPLQQLSGLSVFFRLVGGIHEKLCGDAREFLELGVGSLDEGGAVGFP